MSETVLKSALRRFVFNELTMNANLTVMTPRAFHHFENAIDKTVRDMSRELRKRGVTIINDERKNHAQ